MFGRYCLHALYRWWRCIFGFFQHLGWRMNGTAGIMDAVWNGDLYDKSAHVMKISWRFKPDRATWNSAEDFIATHVGFEHPDVVLKRTVSLYAVTPSEAVFVVLPAGVNLYNCKETPLVYIRQYDEAVRIIRMPLSSFHRLADTVGDPDNKTVVFIHYLARSGSTLLMQILSRFHAQKDTICISEGSPDSQLISDRGKYSVAEFKDVFRSTFRLMCKEPASLVAMKMSIPGGSLELAPLIKETFPKFYQLFTYRNAVPMNRSRLLMYSQLYNFKMIYFAQNSPLRAWLLRLPRERMLRDYYGDKMYQRLRGYLPNFTMFQTICIHTGIHLKAYQLHYSNGVGVGAVWYEDLKTEPRTALGKILDHLGLAEYSDQIPEMLKALDEDSHTNSIVEAKSSAVDRNGVLPFESAMPAIISKVDNLCSVMDLPLLSRQHPLEGTITNAKVSAVL